MEEFFANMDGFLKILWYIAVGSSLIFIIQTAMVFFGFDDDTDIEMESDVGFDSSEVENAQDMAVILPSPHHENLILFKSAYIKSILIKIGKCRHFPAKPDQILVKSQQGPVLFILSLFPLYL